MAVMDHKSELQTREIAGLRKAVNALTKQRSRKRKYIRMGDSLVVSYVQDLMAGKERGGGEAAEQYEKGTRAEALRALRQSWPQHAYVHCRNSRFR